jgi:GT2 family glycosyltransferase
MLTSKPIPILITCYNKEKFIEATISSALLNETAVIVVDDCSTDGTVALTDYKAFRSRAKSTFGQKLTQDTRCGTQFILDVANFEQISIYATAPN